LLRNVQLLLEAANVWLVLYLSHMYDYCILIPEYVKKSLTHPHVKEE